MPVRGIRGATVVREDSRDEVIRATRELLQAIMAANEVEVDDVASVIFTTTPDIRSEYPARAARDLGWTHVALLGATEMDVKQGLPRCIRVLLHVNTDRSPSEMKHIYLHEARTLRTDKR